MTCTCATFGTVGTVAIHKYLPCFIWRRVGIFVHRQPFLAQVLMHFSSFSVVLFVSTDIRFIDTKLLRNYGR